MERNRVTRTISRQESVKVGGNVYFCPPDAQVRPLPGERLDFYRYGVRGNYQTKFIHEVGSPADRDGYLRRQFWGKDNPPPIGE